MKTRAVDVFVGSQEANKQEVEALRSLNWSVSAAELFYLSNKNVVLNNNNKNNNNGNNITNYYIF